jgi:AcrR family transcriptional regulator
MMPKLVATYLHCQCKYFIVLGMVNSAAKVDGRSARGERTRQAVATALLELLERGHMQPTAAEIAEQAGVSLRSVFQHFEDLDSLYAVVAEVQTKRLSGFVSREPASGSLEERIRSFAGRRSELLELITPVRRAALLREPSSAVLAERLRGAHDMARDELERTFGPELNRTRPGDASLLLYALDVATNWSAWDTLRRLNGLTAENGRRVMERTLRALLTGAANPDQGKGRTPAKYT